MFYCIRQFTIISYFFIVIKEEKNSRLDQLIFDRNFDHRNLNIRATNEKNKIIQIKIIILKVI